MVNQLYFKKALIYWLCWVLFVARGLSLIAGLGLLPVAASLVAEHRLSGVQASAAAGLRL